MRVALINARNDEGQFPPLGMLYIAAVLRNDGCEVRVYDPLLTDDGFIDDVSSFKPEVVGIGFMTAQYPRAGDILARLRERLDRAVFVAGGIHPTALPEETLRAMAFDIVIYGEGEYSMRDLCRLLREGKSYRELRGICYRGNGEIVMNPPFPVIDDLDELPLPARDLLDFTYYMSPPGPVRGLFARRLGALMTSRGCPNKCVFCGSSDLLFGRKVRRLSVKRVITEMEHLFTQYHVDAFYFLDDTFTVNPAWVSKLCDELKLLSRRLDVRLKWACQARIDTVSAELLKKMKDAGCRQIEIGVESGTDKVLRALGKNTTVEMIVRNMQVVRKSGLHTVATFMLGNPEETLEDAQRTFDLAKKIHCNFTRFFFTTPFPGTELYAMALKNGWIAQPDFSQTWDILKAHTPVMEILIPRRELSRILTKYQNRFIVRNCLSYVTNIPLIASVAAAALRHPRASFRELARFIATGNLELLLLNILKIYRQQHGRAG